MHQGNEIVRKDMNKVTGRYAKEKDPALKIVELLLDYQADPNKEDLYGLVALHHAAMRDNGDIARLLVNRGGNIKQEDKQGNTPLHIAATYGNTKVVGVLLEAKSDVMLHDEKGQNPLHKAASSGNHNTMNVMLDSLDDEILQSLMREKDRDGNTPLMLSVASGCFECVKIILEKVEDEKFLTSSNNHGEYPIHLGVRSGNKDIVELLHLHGASLDQANGIGQTPVYLAAECPLHNEIEDEECIDIIEYLINK